MPFRAFVAITTIVAIADSSRAPFGGRLDDVQPGSGTVSSVTACDARLVANVQSREFQRPMRSGPQSATGWFTVRSSASGIEYRIPANTKATLFAHALTGFEAVVTFAAGRGRLDMVANPASPELVTEGVSVAPPLATPGDYYLFDSSGFILVRPRQKTFSSFVLADHEFNYENRRNGWPSEFAFRPAGSFKIDTLGARPLDARVIRHVPTRVYWILKMGAGGTGVPGSAFGRLSIADAPPGEGGVARWIGPTEVLADMANRGAVVDEREIELTSILPLYPPQQSSIGFAQRQHIECLRTADIDLAKLVLPSDFKEEYWPGFQNEPGLPRLTERTAAKWRAVPRSK